MATFISGGADVYRAQVYGKAHSGTVDYLQRAGQHFRSQLNDFAAGLMEKSDQLYRRYDESKVVRLARAATRKIANWHRPDGISMLSEIGHFQHANPEMRRWVMANPEVRHMHHRQECHGYGDGYIDTEPGRFGRDHYDYRRATQSMWIDNEDGTSTATTWVEDLRDDDREFAIEEKTDILLSWECLRGMLRKGSDDPTDPYNSSL